MKKRNKSVGGMRARVRGSVKKKRRSKGARTEWRRQRKSQNENNENDVGETSQGERGRRKG